MRTRRGAREDIARALAEEMQIQAEEAERRRRTFALTLDQRRQLSACLRDFGRRVLPAREPFDPKRMVRVLLCDVPIADPLYSCIHIALAILARAPRGILVVHSVEVLPDDLFYTIHLFVKEDST